MNRDNLFFLKLFFIFFAFLFFPAVSWAQENDLSLPEEIGSIGRLVVVNTANGELIKFQKEESNYSPLPVMVSYQPKVIQPTLGELEELFTQHCDQYGIDKELIKRIAKCESGFNPGAVNGPYGGMFQFLASTWISTRKAMGLDPNPGLRFNSGEAIKTTAFKISRNGAGAWPVCSR